MKSKSIFMDDLQFKKFVNPMPGIELKRKPKDESNFPLDFCVYYKDFTLNFEYISQPAVAAGSLEFYSISNKDDKTIKNNISTLSEIKKKIKMAIEKN